jgi:hypothetical protein
LKSLEFKVIFGLNFREFKNKQFLLNKKLPPISYDILITAWFIPIDQFYKHPVGQILFDQMVWRYCLAIDVIDGFLS